MLPYGRQAINEDDIQAVVEVLRSDWLTTGPMVERFERAVAERVGVAEAVVVSSGTAALHAAMFALGIGPGDEVIVPTMTFAATANCVVYQGERPCSPMSNRSPCCLGPSRSKPGSRPAPGRSSPSTMRDSRAITRPCERSRSDTAWPWSPMPPMPWARRIAADRWGAWPI